MSCPERYRNKVILAPMVRIGTLPSRLLALDYGADLVYSEEIIDFRLLRSKRIENSFLGTIDFIDSEGVVVFRTCAREKDKVILQLGTADADRAVAAAKLVENDVSGIDVNMGCPKDFSIKGGMGAALLCNPGKVKCILEKLVEQMSIPVTCKIRILPTIESTIDLVKMISKTGVSAIAVHGRVKEEGRNFPNKDEFILEITKNIKDIPIIANGGSSDIECYGDIFKFKEKTSASSVMVARASEANPSVFRKEGPLPLDQVIKEYIKYAIEYEAHVKNVKYCIQHMLRSDQASERGKNLLAANDMLTICKIWHLEPLYYAHEEKRRVFNGSSQPPCKKLKKDECNEAYFKFNRKDFVESKLPKDLLLQFSLQFKYPLKYNTKEQDRHFYGQVTVGHNQFASLCAEKNKKYAEQNAALVALYFLKPELFHQITKTSSSPPLMCQNNM